MSERAGDTEAVAGTATTLLLLVENDRNRALLADQLDDEFDVRTTVDTSFAELQFDLCLLDGPSLGKHEDELRQSQADTAPTFLPYLLLTGQRSPNELPGEIWEIVDEVIQRPVSKAELDTRIDNLVRRRRLSLKLTRQKERSEQRFESLFQSTPDPVVVVTPDGAVTEANEAFGGMFGVDPDEITNRPLTELDLPPTESAERVLLRIADEVPSTTTVQWDREEEAPLVTEVNTDVITGLGEAANRIGIFRDVTQRAKRAAELERQNERLEGFADTIAHDLRSPLSVAQGRLELVRESGDEEHFSSIEQSHDRMEEMITELLTLAKQGQAVLDPDTVVLAATVERAWDHVETAAASLELDVDRSALISADEGRLCELLENLFRNAIEHGGRAVTVRVGLFGDGAGLYVADSGPGIGPGERDEVFEAGYTDREGGTGFGLSIVKQIVDGHGWEISITESDAGGARFEIGGVHLARDAA
jgi:PAS domain S-box-containing protein